MGLLDFIFGNRQKKVKDYLNKGATVLDVRTRREYNSGAITNSKHIPLQELHSRYTELDTTKSYVVVCKSGVRSAKATKFLNLNNIDAVNGGGWLSLNRIID
ncbi:rhodanese-like domain-containing protein [Flavobacteriaceae sp. LMIT009]|jgi:rhodanese-related sulfurtransferase